jgi:dCMP deaminase
MVLLRSIVCRHRFKILHIVSISLSFIRSCKMSNVKNGDLVWVKLQNNGVWWPSCIVECNERSAHDDLALFPVSTVVDTIIAKLFATESGASDGKLALLKPAEEGIAWYLSDTSIDYDIDGNNLNQCSEQLKGRYERARTIWNERQRQRNANDLSLDAKYFGASDTIDNSEEAYEMEGNKNDGVATTSMFQQVAETNLRQLPVKVSKRLDAISWDDYFMALAFLSAKRSKDPSTQVGACIVDADKRIVGIGYNGFPRGCSDDELPWAREADDPLDTKYPYVCHAEMNAILNKNIADVRGCSIYVALFPCNNCAKIIIQSGIKEVVFFSDKYKDTVKMKASRRMLEMAGIKLRQHKPIDRSVLIDFDCIERGSTGAGAGAGTAIK